MNAVETLAIGLFLGAVIGAAGRHIAGRSVRRRFITIPSCDGSGVHYINPDSIDHITVEPESGDTIIVDNHSDDGLNYWRTPMPIDEVLTQL